MTTAPAPTAAPADRLGEDTYADAWSDTDLLNLRTTGGGQNWATGRTDGLTVRRVAEITGLPEAKVRARLAAFTGLPY